MKKILSILLVVLMLVGMMPINAMHVHAAESKYVKVTESLADWSGEYLIVYEDGKIAFDGGLSTVDADNNYKAVTITDNAIVATDTTRAMQVVIAPVSGGYSIKTASGWYLGRTSTSNGMDEHQTTARVNTISYNASSGITIKSSGGPTLQLYKSGSTYRFRYYKSAQNAICLYKLEEATSCQHTNTTTTTENATCTEAGSTTVTCNDCGAEVSKTTIEATGHNYVGGVCQNCGAQLYTVSFSVPAQVGSVDSITANESGIVTLPAAGNYSVENGAKYDYTFFGWIEQSLSEEQTDVPAVHKAGESFKPSKNVTLSAVYTYSVAGGGTAGYNKTELSAIAPTDKVVIVATKTGSNAGNYAMSNDNGTGSAPAAVAVTVDGDTVTANSFENILWNVVKDGDNYTFYPDGTTSTWLYCTGTNNGVRVGTNTNKTFVLDASGYLKHVSTSRYLGVYLAQDWRCYTSSTTTNIANQTFTFYVEGAGDTAWYTSTLESADTTCTHTNTTSTTTDPSCTVAGKTTVTCADCGAFISETEIPATGHTEVVDEAKAPTCVDTGLTEGSHCSVCNTVIKERETVAATGEHTYVDGACSVCGAAKPAGGATAWQLVTDVNEIIAGGQFVVVGYNSVSKTYYAMPNTISSKITGEVVTVDDGMVVSAVGDTIIWTVETCGSGIALYNGTAYLKYGSSTNLANNGTTPYEFTLTAMGDGFKVIAAANTSRGLVFRGASYNQFGGYAMSNVTDASTEYFGIQFYKMVTLCDHETVEDVAAVAPTCESVGYTAGKQCADCGEFTEGHEEIAALGHNWDEGVVTTPATCETDGVRKLTCQNDASHTKEEVIEALGHSWDEGVVTTPATCETDGVKTVTCQNDASHTKEEVIEALGHDWDEGEVTKAATCDEAGEMLLTCQNDNSHTKTEVIPASGHSYDASGVCENCGKKISRFVLVDDYTTILAGGEYIIAARVGDSFYAISTSSTTVNPASQSVTVEGSGADMYVTYAEGLPIWDVDFYPYGINAFTLYNPERELYLRAKDKAFVAATEDAWAWSFADASSEGFETDGVYGISISGTDTIADGATAFTIVSDTIVDRAIGLSSGATADFRTQSLRGQDINVELFFFKLEEAQEESYTVTFVEDGTTTMTQQVSVDENVLKMPQPVNSTMPEGYTKFVGWVTLPYMESLIIPSTIYSAEDVEGVNNVASINGDTTFYALYSREDPNAEGETMSYHLVTNENQLVVGEKYIIVAIDKEGNYHAMSKDQLSDDRGTSPVRPDADGVITFLPDDNVGVFMLMQGFSAGSFGFLDVNLDKFLYCSSSGTNNSLKSQSTLDAAASFFITVDSSDYVSTIVADVSSARNTMLFNPDYNLISSYSPSIYAGLDLYLYVGVPNSTFATYYTTGLCHHNWETTSKEASCTEPGYTMQTCTICGKVEMLEFAAHGHDVGSSTVVTAPTCTTTGLARSTCNKCNESFDEVLPALGHTTVVDAAVAPTCTETGLTEGSHCSVCSIVLVPQQVVAALGHTEVIDAAVPADCVNTGLTEGSHCSVCDTVLVEQEVVDALGHSYDEGVITKPTITEDGYITYTCTVCGHSYQEVIPAIGPLKFSTAALTLTQNLSINFRAKGELFAEGAYTQPYAVFKFGYEELTVTDYVIVDGKYQFTCYNISPSQMTETVSATLYGYFDGELIEGETMTYSVGQYCLALLNNTSDEKLHTLIVDMLYYGDEASKYANYRTEVPATSILTEEQKALHTTAVPSLQNVLDKPVRVENAKASWKAVTLVLDDTVEIRYRLAAESIDGLTAKITAGGNSWTVDEFTPVPGEDGQYYVRFDQLSAAMMRETVLITIYEGSTAVSDTLSYSVESYAYAQQNNAKLSNLVLEMMRYGDSVYSYFTKEDV